MAAAGHHSRPGVAIALACIAAASLSPLIAQPIVSTTGDPYLQELDTPWKLSEEVLQRLARLAVEYEEAARDFECREATRRVKYPRSGRPSEGGAREATYMFALEDGSMVPVQGRGTSFRRSGKAAVPPAHAWTQLFAARNQPYIAYRDVGEVPHAFGTARQIQFRGAVPFHEGTGIRQWEGTLLVDSHSLLPLELDAQPLNLWPRLEHQRLEYLESFKIAFFGLVIRFKKKPVADRVHVRFDVQANGLTLPVEAHVERVEKTRAHEATVRSRVMASYEYRSAGPDATAP